MKINNAKTVKYNPLMDSEFKNIVQNNLIILNNFFENNYEIDNFLKFLFYDGKILSFKVEPLCNFVEECDKNNVFRLYLLQLNNEINEYVNYKINNIKESCDVDVIIEFNQINEVDDFKDNNFLKVLNVRYNPLKESTFLECIKNNLTYLPEYLINFNKFIEILCDNKSLKGMKIDLKKLREHLLTFDMSSQNIEHYNKIIDRFENGLNTCLEKQKKYYTVRYEYEYNINFILDFSLDKLLKFNIRTINNDVNSDELSKFDVKIKNDDIKELFIKKYVNKFKEIYINSSIKFSEDEINVFISGMPITKESFYIKLSNIFGEMFNEILFDETLNKYKIYINNLGFNEHVDEKPSEESYEGFFNPKYGNSIFKNYNNECTNSEKYLGFKLNEKTINTDVDSKSNENNLTENEMIQEYKKLMRIIMSV